MTPPVAVNGAVAEKTSVPSVSAPPVAPSVTLNARRFAEAVAFVGKFVPTRAPAPVLAGILITSTGESLNLVSFDYELCARTSVQAVGAKFTTLVSGSILRDMAKLIAKRPIDETVTLRLEGSKVRVEYGTSSALLQTMPPADFPDLPTLPESVALIEGAKFAAGVKRAVPAAGKDETLPFLTGVRLEFHDFAVRMVATDRYRLAVAVLAGAVSEEEERHPLVPAKTLKTIGQVFGKSEYVYIHHQPELRKDAAVYASELVGFSDGERSVSVRPLEGEFIKYWGLFPDTYASNAVVDTRALIGLVERALPYVERNTPVRLTFEPGTVMIESGSGDEAQHSEAMPAEYEGATFTIAFNPNYLIDGLKAVAEGLRPSETNQTRLNFTQPAKPCVLQPVGDGDVDPNYRYLIMPIRLSS